MDKQDWPERRHHPRLEMYAGVFLVVGERGYLSEMCDVSAGGIRVTRPGNWQSDRGRDCQLFCILEQERILRLEATIVHETESAIGLVFHEGYAVPAEQLLAESRNWR